MRLPLPDADWLRERLIYDPLDGSFLWRTRPRSDFPREQDWITWNKSFAGKPAGALSKGKVGIRINTIRYFAHRVAFKMVTGQEPPAGLDHRNGDGTNNTWDNLRPATQSQNIMNARARGNKKTGLPRGVGRSHNRFYGYLTINGVWKYLGRFDTPEQASAAYQTAAKVAHGEFWANGR